jgi:hypothetical protein
MLWNKNISGSQKVMPPIFFYLLALINGNNHTSDFLGQCLPHPLESQLFRSTNGSKIVDSKMAENEVRLKWTSSDKRFFFFWVAEVEKLFCIGERLPKVHGQACGCEYCQTVGKTGQHERQHFMTKHRVVVLTRTAEWPSTTPHTQIRLL